MVAFFLQQGLARAASVEIPLPGGAVSVELSHAGPTGQLSDPAAPQTAGFHPPAIFSAPLPTGSGARALGQAGAFTAVADDATAASWNPAGLIQLERPEVSVVCRNSVRRDRHHSSDRALTVDCDRYSNHELNYASAVYPFLVNGCNVVGSFNFQEAYDFTQSFSARFADRNRWQETSNLHQDFQSSQTNRVTDSHHNIVLSRATTTHSESQIHQILNSSVLSQIDFAQAGTIDAFSPAFAVELTPQWSVGVALNLYADGAARGNSIRSTSLIEYEGETDSSATIDEALSSSTILNWEGSVSPGGQHSQSQPDLPVSGAMGPVLHSDTNHYTQTASYAIRGRYREENRTEQFYGVNATLGALWVASDQLTLGAAVDLPWTGRGKQTRNISHRVTATDSNGVATVSRQFETQRRDVEYTFPLYWSLGALWRWSDRLYSSMDVSCTHWSDFSYKAEGEERINPLSGKSAAASALDECWSVRLGSEYLWVLSWTELPLRGGVFWEQRPALGAPDTYWGATFGTGISLGKNPGRLILDIAYRFERGEEVMGSLLPGQGMRSDSTQHQLFVSAIFHF